MRIISNASRKRSNQGLTQAVAIKRPQGAAMTTTNQKQQVMMKKKSSRKLPKP
jgi:hypothetical protein